jgi:hypothetical protein
MFNDKLELFSHIIVKTNPFVYSAAFDVNCDVILLWYLDKYYFLRTKIAKNM